MGLQDELLIRATKIPYLRHARVEGFHPADGLRLPRPVGAVSVGGGLATTVGRIEFLGFSSNERKRLILTRALSFSA